MKKKDDFYSWLDQIAAKKADDWSLPPMKPLSTDEVYTQMLNDPTYNYHTFYDMRPFMAEQMLMNNPKAHIDDIGKTMYHPTFSDQSAYSGYINNYNPLGIVGGHWNQTGTEYTPSESQLANYFNYDTTRRYLDKAEDHPIKINMPMFYNGTSGNPMSQFINMFAQKTYQGLKARKIKNIDNAYRYVMRQMAMESGYADAGSRKAHNYGGILVNGKKKQFKNDDAFLDYYLNLVNSRYNAALNAKDLYGYADQMGKLGYYKGETVNQYYGKLNGLKTFGRMLDADLAKNRNIYDKDAGIQVDPTTNQAELVQSVPTEQQPIETPLNTPYDVNTLRTSILPDIRTILDPHIKIPMQPSLYPQPESYDTTQFDHGKSGIYINPANRGKFNVTKKRTGKTTEQLSHSKNPLTRKRAIFALNARKWHN